MNELLDHCPVLEVRGDPTGVAVTGVEHDSRQVAGGELFCCVPGRTNDGHAFAADAVARGAAGLLCEHFVDLGDRSSVIQARVAPGEVKPAMARLAAAFHGFPARDLLVAGVTGTNGKTTVTHLIGDILRGAGWAATVIGTLSGVRTTPEAPELQRMLARARDEAQQHDRRGAVAMEVSSHALVQHRVDAVCFDVAVFTNLSHEHLDFHGSMEDYWRAKSSLFTPERARRGVVWAGDRWGRRLLDEAVVPMVAVTRDAASEVEPELGRTTFLWRGQRVRLPLTGMLNVDNALLAAEAAVSVGFDPAEVAAALEDARPVPGRMELVAGPREPGGPPFVVIVDYAHTPAALEVALSASRSLVGAAGRLIVVFGCGGDRDAAKRPAMGEVAVRHADKVVLTTDNPRHEDPDAIILQIDEGARRARGRDDRPEVEVVTDRVEAIESVLGRAAPGDVVLVAGRGHETEQEIDGRRRPLDDRRVVRGALGLPEAAGSGAG
jgi:UDP-N-acetylmuramoyl-L-alanyl-D-glutamate--2,6-diaminopimelate ligase